jgi:hypothetical protein
MTLWGGRSGVWTLLWLRFFYLCRLALGPSQGVALITHAYLVPRRKGLSCNCTPPLGLHTLLYGELSSYTEAWYHNTAFIKVVDCLMQGYSSLINHSWLIVTSVAIECHILNLQLQSIMSEFGVSPLVQWSPVTINFSRSTCLLSPHNLVNELRSY